MNKQAWNTLVKYIVLIHISMSLSSISCMEFHRTKARYASRANYQIAIVSKIKFRPSEAVFEEYINEQNEEYLLARKIAQYLTLKLELIAEPKWRLFWTTLAEDVKNNGNRLPAWINIETIFTIKEIFNLNAISKSIDLTTFIEESLLEIAHLISKFPLSYLEYR